MPHIPRDRTPEATPAMLREGYAFIPNRCRRYGTDVFRTRLLLQDTICLTGPGAAALVYDDNRFLRAGAAPARLRDTLFGRGGVQGLDGAAHRRRKGMFMSLMTPDRIARLTAFFADEWRACWRRADQGADRVVLFDAVEAILSRAALAWAGVPVPEAELPRRRRDLAALIEGAGAVGPRYWRGRAARVRTDAWAADLIERVRARRLETPAESALAVIAWHRNTDGALLEPRTAAVELINILRPIVAVDRYVVFTAVALHEHPEARQRLREGSEDEAERFVQEVRRFYPFFPFVAARVRDAFHWHGYRFPEGERVLLDLYGTNRDARSWDDPGAFQPERFRRWDGGAFDFIPQGGGGHEHGHRCAGEWITIALMKTALRRLLEMDYDVPEQDLAVDLSRIPAIPRSRFVILPSPMQ